MSETNLPPLSVDFAPAWWRAHYGMDFGEELWRDPLRRVESDRDRRRLLWERFGEVGLGEADPAPRPNVAAQMHRFMAAVWGCEIRYLPDQSPAAVALPAPLEQMERLRLPDLETSPVVRRVFQEARTLESHYGFCEAGLDLGAPLNNAVSVFGAEILTTCLTDPDLARRVLLLMAQALLAVELEVTDPLNHQSFPPPRPRGFLGNCPVCMVSPRTYQEVVLPADLWYRQHFQELSLHHCGPMHAYLEVYRALAPNALDVGFTSDRRQVRAAYPDLPLSLMLEASALVKKSETEVDDLVGGMLQDAGPPELITSIWVAEAGPEVADETVHSLMTAPERLRRVL